MKRPGWFLISIGLISALSIPATANNEDSQLPILVIGASYSEGKTPYNNGIAPLGGTSVGFGSYLSLGQALTRVRALPGWIINEGQAGATTFARLTCPPGSTTCGPAGFDSYQTQMDRALTRVALPPTFTQYNSKFVIITIPNDCLHSDAFGIPQNLAQPCTIRQMNESVDRLISVGQNALALGLTPIYDMYPAYTDLDLELTKSLFGLTWVIDQTAYNRLKSLHDTRLKNELPGALVLDIWKQFTHIGDGLHPNAHSVKHAAHLIIRKIIK